MLSLPAPVLRLQGVSVQRGSLSALAEVDWTVRTGERWVVLGANGAGKTTLLQVATALLSPTSGTVEVLGEPLATADLDDVLPRIGLASAALAERLPDHERALDVVLTAAYAKLARGSEDYDGGDEARAARLLARLGCAALAHRELGTLSEGERKRVQIARALMADPELLLLDEPAAGLDLGAREALLRHLTKIAANPLAPALVLVTHHVEEVPAGITHALLLRSGRLVAAGPVGSVLTGPTLSKCFGLPLVVDAHDGRYAARLAPLRRVDALAVHP